MKRGASYTKVHMRHTLRVFLEGLKCLSEEEKDPLYSGIWLGIHFIAFDAV